jgi:hypothetical protein
MTADMRMPGEPVEPPLTPTGSMLPGSPASSNALTAAFALVREWAGPSLQALVLGGSHASGEGVWAQVDGSLVTLSDLDLYAVLGDATACRAAESRARAAQPQLAQHLLAAGLGAPLEVAFLTRDGLSRLPARPGALELLRTGRVVMGDASVRDVIPHWQPGDIAREEITLLLENRAFELLLGWPALASGSALECLRGRHARLKTIADLAGVFALEAEEWPAGAAARIDWARSHALAGFAEHVPGALVDVPAALDGLWDQALDWRAHDAAHPVTSVPSPAEARTEWRAAARAWSAVWWHHEGGTSERFDPWPLATETASRAPLRRRVRRALEPASRSGVTPPIGGRLRHLLAGTPQHRVNASASVLLIAAAVSPSAPALPAGALRALRSLGVSDARDWEQARAQVVRAWDLWVLDGQRTAEAR